MGASVKPFSEQDFYNDIRMTAVGLNAPFSATTTRTVLDTFADSFRVGATLWKTTGRPRDQLCYRFFARSQEDTINIARRAGLLGETDSAALISNWTDAYGTAATQSCDFDAVNGLAKTWLYLGGMHPSDQVLGRAFVPETVRRQLRSFHEVGLDYIRFMAVDHRHHSANIYFRTRGPLTWQRAAEILAVVGVEPPSPQLVEEIRAFVPEDFCVAVTVSLGSGKPERACFYALKLPPDVFPDIPERIAQFFEKAPCYDAETVNVVGWSFGPDGGSYIKAERAYNGDLAALLSSWDCYFSGSTRRDAVLDAAVDEPTRNVG